MSDSNSDSDEPVDYTVISSQAGAVISKIGKSHVRKMGYRVVYNEEAALRLVKKYTSVPVPAVVLSQYYVHNGMKIGSITMGFVRGSALNSVWDSFEETTKARICRDIWAMV